MSEQEWTDGTDVPTEQVQDALTTYQALKRINRALREAGLDKQIPYQMVYNYTTARLRAGTKPMIKAHRKTVGDKDVTYIEVTDLEEWLVRYVRKAVALANA